VIIDLGLTEFIVVDFIEDLSPIVVIQSVYH